MKRANHQVELFGKNRGNKLDLNTNGKLYYSISEVAEATGVKPYVLRFWEKEIPVLKPKKNRAGNRSYQLKDIDLVKQIKQLLYSEGFTIEGAKAKLKAMKNDPDVQDVIETAKARDLLLEVKKELEEILKILT